jgi:hypothetical protein
MGDEGFLGTGLGRGSHEGTRARRVGSPFLAGGFEPILRRRLRRARCARDSLRSGEAPVPIRIFNFFGILLQGKGEKVEKSGRWALDRVGEVPLRVDFERICLGDLLRWSCGRPDQLCGMAGRMDEKELRRGGRDD